MQYLAMRTQFQNILNRSDCADTLAQTFFQMALARCQREMRLPFMEEQLNIDTSAGAVSTIAVPDDWIENIAFIVTDANGYTVELQYLEVGNFMRKTNEVLGEATYYTRIGGNWSVTDAIPQGASAFVYYYGEMGTLSNDTDEPTIAMIAPDLLIYGALTYAADYFIDDRGGAWEQKFQGFAGQLQSQSEDAEDETNTNAVAPAFYFDDSVWG